MVFATMADGNWKSRVDVGDTLGNLVDLRFADDLLYTIANFGPEVAQFVESVGKMVLRYFAMSTKRSY